jgi:hypothetical protein
VEMLSSACLCLAARISTIKPMKNIEIKAIQNKNSGFIVKLTIDSGAKILN